MIEIRHADESGFDAIWLIFHEIVSITTSKWADFVILDGRVPEPVDEDFRSLSVEATFFAGREVYSSSRQ